MPKRLGPQELSTVQLTGVQVSLARLMKLLQAKGGSGGFELSSAVIPTIDVRRVIEDEMGASLDPARGDTAEMYGNVVGAGGAAYQAVCQIFNPLGSGRTVHILSAIMNPLINATYNAELHNGAFAVPDANAILVRGPAIMSGANDDCLARFFGNDGTALPTRLKVTDQWALGGQPLGTPHEFVARPLWLPPGRGWCVKSISNNAGTNMIVTFRFREYAL